jgi:dTDP-4-dehydrorhamnose 3,5-epimerase
MIAIETKIKGAFIIKPVHHEDDRGSFYTSFNREVYNKLGILNFNVAQMNTSVSNIDVIRGLHYQAGLDAQAKLVWVSHGIVLDVFVDLREDSPTFGKWDSVQLSANGNRVYIPKGCAHGFVSKWNGTVFNYLCSNYWNKQSERTLLWNDPDLNIDWGNIADPIISPKDMEGIPFKYCEKYNED